jgi:hypothetical protein
MPEAAVLCTGRMNAESISRYIVIEGGADATAQALRVPQALSNLSIVSLATVLVALAFRTGDWPMVLVEGQASQAVAGALFMDRSTGGVR